MWETLLLAQASTDLPSWEVILRSYGNAAPLILGLGLALRALWLDRNRERDRADRLADKAMEQQERLLPLAKDLVDTLKRWEQSS